MKLGIWSSYYRELSIEEAVQRFVDNGIYSSELSDEHGCELLERSDDVLETARKFAAFLKERNFDMSQGHLWLKIKICSDETAIEKLFKWVDMYEEIGVKNMVLHCDRMLDLGVEYEKKLAFCKALDDLSHEYSAYRTQVERFISREQAKTPILGELKSLLDGVDEQFGVEKTELGEVVGKAFRSEEE